MSTYKKIGDALVGEGLVKLNQLEAAYLDQKQKGGSLGAALVRQGILREKELIEFLERFYQVPSVDLNNFEISAHVLDLISKEICQKHSIIPLQKAEGTLVVAFSDPGNIYIKDDISFLTGLKIQVVVASEGAIQLAIEKNYSSKVQYDDLKSDIVEEDAKKGSKAELLTDAKDQEGAPIVKFVNSVLSEAIRKGASDIHFEPYEKRFRIRFRIDGDLIEQPEPPLQAAPAICSRLKIISKLDIAEKRRTQDGRIQIQTQKGHLIDFRVNVLPTLYGEKIVLRIQDKSNLKLNMAELGFEPDDLKTFQQAIHLPQGMVLLTGPTGSGKTTTIYSALSELNKPDVNICTAEDPIEYNLEGINQVQVNTDVDLTFANCLRAFLRQDPDIVLVGEIRDLETAEIAFKAASTGHMVVSTLHTNDAPSTIIRLIDIGIPPYIVTSTISLIVAQRLMGLNCEQCKVPIRVRPEVLLKLGVPQEEIKDYQLMKGEGCNYCNGRGIKGRIAIYELMKITPAIKDKILAGGTPSDLRIIARQEGMRTLRRSALLKLKRGLTTIEEVINSSIKDIA